ncbi:MAG: tail fiber domain-containing protein, partial [Planctomycetota bacterium]
PASTTKLNALVVNSCSGCANGSGDNLGNHTATRDLNMGSHKIYFSGSNSIGVGYNVWTGANYYQIYMSYGPSDGNSDAGYWGDTYRTRFNQYSGYGWTFQYSSNNSNFYWGVDIQQGSLAARHQIRAPIYYDLDNTNYYANPASTSYFNDFRANIMYDRNNTAYYANPASTSYFNDFRPNIIYDRNDTWYYVDPNSSSRMRMVHFSRDHINECCSGGNYTISLAEYTNGNGRLSTIQFYNNGYEEGFWRLYRGPWGRWLEAGSYQTDMDIRATGYMIGTNHLYWSSRKRKRDITPLSQEQLLARLEQIRNIDSVTYYLKRETNDPARANDPEANYRGVPHLGFIQETLPPEVREKDGYVSAADMDGLLFAGIKALDLQVQELRMLVRNQGGFDEGYFVNPKETSNLNGVRAKHLYYAGGEAGKGAGLAEIRSGDLSGVMDPSRRFIDARAMDGMLLSGIRALDAKVSDLGSQVHDLAGLVDSLFAQKQ